MKHLRTLALMVSVILLGAGLGMAAEHGGSAAVAAPKEHGGSTAAKPAKKTWSPSKTTKTSKTTTSKTTTSKQTVPTTAPSTPEGSK